MTKLDNRQRCLLCILAIAIVVAIALSCLAYSSATASTTMLLRLYHDQDTTGTVTDGDMVAAGVEVTVTETNCAGQVCAASPVGWIVHTDSDGYASIELEDAEYTITAPCMAMTVVASEVSGQSAQNETTCRLWRVWMPAVAR